MTYQQLLKSHKNEFNQICEGWGVVSHSQRSDGSVCEDRVCVCVCVCMLSLFKLSYEIIWKPKRECVCAVKRRSKNQRRKISVKDSRLRNKSNNTM